MRLVPHEWRHLDNWRREMDRFFEPLTQGLNSPRVDIMETQSELIAVCEIPGIENKEDIHIDVADNVLTISGNIHKWLEEKGESIHRRERYTGSFTRSVSLPLPVNAEEVKAVYRNGLLKVHMPKAEGSPKKQIDVEFS